MAGSKQQERRSRRTSFVEAVPPAASSQDTLTTVTSMVETEIVPRLIAAHQARLRSRGLAMPTAGTPPSSSPASSCVEPPAPASTASSRSRPIAMDAEFIAAFAAELIASDSDAIRTRIEGLRADGMTVETLCLAALAPAARHLGDLWEKDLCSFLEVTTGTMLLHGIMNVLRPAFQRRPSTGNRPRSAMLVTAPGEQHRFGLSMLAEFFRNDGWQVALPHVTTIAQITALSAARPIDLVGFSAGSERHLGSLAACIAALRAGSRNPDILVMVGGPIFLGRPELVRMVGADGTATDAEDAVRQARALLKALNSMPSQTVTRRPARAGSQHHARLHSLADACDQNSAPAQ